MTKQQYTETEEIAGIRHRLTIQNNTGLTPDFEPSDAGRMLHYRWQGNDHKDPKLRGADVQDNKEDSQFSTFVEPGESRTITCHLLLNSKSSDVFYTIEKTMSTDVPGESRQESRTIRTVDRGDEVIVYVGYLDVNGVWQFEIVKTFSHDEWFS